MPKRTFRVTNSFVKNKCSFILGNSLQIGVRVQASRRWVHDFPDWNSGKIYTFQRQIDLLMQIHRSRSVQRSHHACRLRERNYPLPRDVYTTDRRGLRTKRDIKKKWKYNNKFIQKRIDPILTMSMKISLLPKLKSS